jgi:glycosyltransferase involved in cell wall biosynthesis
MGPDAILTHQSAANAMRILFVSTWYPYPANNGSKLRVYHLLRGLAQVHDLTLLSFAHEPGDGAASSPLHAFCREVRAVPWHAGEPNKWQAYAGLLSLTPRSLAAGYVPAMAQAIEQTLDGGKFDLVIASQLGAARYANRFRGLPALFEEVELGVIAEQYTQAKSLKQRLRYGLTWLKHRRYLARLLHGYTACTVASEQERRLVAEAIPGYRAVELVPNCVDVAGYAAVRETVEPHSLIFTGSFRYFANHEAMTWFLAHVYPLIQRAVPDVRLIITGDHADLPLPSATNVTLTGLVDDVRPLISRAACSVVPIHTGGGTRLKILEAMALGTPVVTTSKGAEGLGAEPDRQLLIADSPQAFAAAVVRLLTTPELRGRLAAAAHAFVLERYDWGATLPRFLDLVGRLTPAA